MYARLFVGALIVIWGSSFCWAQVDSGRVDSAQVAVTTSEEGVRDSASAVVQIVATVSDSSHEVVSSAVSDSNKAGMVASTEGKKAAKQLTDTAERLGGIFSAGNVIAALFLIVTAYISVWLMTWLIGIAAERFGQYRLKLMMLVPIVRIFIWAGTLYLVIEGIFQPSEDKLLAFAASAGLAIGFASQDVLKNIFGGLLIILDRPFQVGDKIQVGGHYGEVVNIGLRSVRIVTPDDNLVSVPNSEMVNQSVSNANAGALDCQVVIELYLPIDVDLRQAKKLAYEAAATSRFVYLNKPIVVVVSDMYDKGFLTKLKVKAYVLDTRFEFAFASDVAERAKAAFVEAGFYGASAGSVMQNH